MKTLGIIFKNIIITSIILSSHYSYSWNCVGKICFFNFASIIKNVFKLYFYFFKLLKTTATGVKTLSIIAVELTIYYLDIIIHSCTFCCYYNLNSQQLKNDILRWRGKTLVLYRRLRNSVNIKMKYCRYTSYTIYNSVEYSNVLVILCNVIWKYVNILKMLYTLKH